MHTNNLIGIDARHLDNVFKEAIAVVASDVFYTTRKEEDFEKIKTFLEWAIKIKDSNIFTDNPNKPHLNKQNTYRHILYEYIKRLENVLNQISQPALRHTFTKNLPVDFPDGDQELHIFLRAQIILIQEIMVSIGLNDISRKEKIIDMWETCRTPKEQKNLLIINGLFGKSFIEKKSKWITLHNLETRKTEALLRAYIQEKEHQIWFSKKLTKKGIPASCFEFLPIQIGRKTRYQLKINDMDATIQAVAKQTKPATAVAAEELAAGAGAAEELAAGAGAAEEQAAASRIAAAAAEAAAKPIAAKAATVAKPVAAKVATVAKPVAAKVATVATGEPAAESGAATTEEKAQALKM